MCSQTADMQIHSCDTRVIDATLAAVLWGADSLVVPIGRPASDVKTSKCFFTGW